MDLLNTVPICVQRADPRRVPNFLKGDPIEKKTKERSYSEGDADADVMRCTTCPCGNCTAAPGINPSEGCCFCSDKNNKTDDDKKFACFLGSIGLWNDSLLVQNKAQKLKVGLRYINDGLFTINPATFVGPVDYGQDLCGHYFLALNLRLRDQKAVQAPDWFTKKDHKYLEAPVVTLVVAQRNYFERNTSIWACTNTPALSDQYINTEDVVGRGEKQIHGDVRVFCHFDLLKMLLNDKHPTLCLCPSAYVVPDEDNCVVQTIVD